MIALNRKVLHEVTGFWRKLGELLGTLGVPLTDTTTCTFSLGQQAYIKQILGHFSIENAHTVVNGGRTQSQPKSPHLSPALLTPAEKTKYCKMIGCLMYATIMTHPDITFAVSTLSQYLNAPHITHLQAVTQIFHYLAGMKDFKFILGDSHSAIAGYSDADWASQIHHHSIAGFAFFVGIRAVSWSLKKQPIITLSSRGQICHPHSFFEEYHLDSYITY